VSLITFFEPMGDAGEPWYKRQRVLASAPGRTCCSSPTSVKGHAMLVVSSEISCDKSDQVRGHRDVDGIAAHLQVGFLLQGPYKPGYHQ